MNNKFENEKGKKQKAPISKHSPKILYCRLYSVHCVHEMFLYRSARLYNDVV